MEIVFTVEAIQAGDTFLQEAGNAISVRTKSAKEGRGLKMNSGKKGAWVFVVVVMVFLLSRCSSPSSSSYSSRSSSYDDSYREGLSNFVNEYKDTMGW